MRPLCLALAVLAAGCGRTPNLWPLSMGWKNDYRIRNGLATYVEEIKVARRVPVAGEYGYEVVSILGASRLAWKGNELLASALPNTRFSPPIPILVANEKDATRRKKTTVEVAGKRTDAEAVLTQAEDELTLGGEPRKVIRATLTLHMPNRDIQTTSYYLAGVGLVRQQQLSNSEFQVGVDLIGALR